MSRITAGIQFVCGLLIIFSPLAAQESTLIEFKLKDQFDREYSSESWQGNILIVIGSDREGSQYSQTLGRSHSQSAGRFAGILSRSVCRGSGFAGGAFFPQRFCEGEISRRPVKMAADGLERHFCPIIPIQGRCQQYRDLCPRRRTPAAENRHGTRSGRA